MDYSKLKAEILEQLREIIKGNIPKLKPGRKRIYDKKISVTITFDENTIRKFGGNQNLKDILYKIIQNKNNYKYKYFDGKISKKIQLYLRISDVENLSGLKFVFSKKIALEKARLKIKDLLNSIP